MKIFSAAQIKACDAYTIHASKINSIDLVERAALACIEFITAKYNSSKPFVVLCGMGNNGADGLAIARLLLQKGYGVKIFLVHHKAEASVENKACLNKILRINAALVEYIPTNTFLADFPAQAIIIDAILGTGLRQAAEGWMADFIEHINELPNKKIAIDIPSGMPADTVPNTSAVMISASDTLSFQFYKRSFLHPETAVHCGNIHLLDIGLHPTFIQATHTHYNIIDAQKLSSFLKKKAAFSYKNQHGNTIIIGGSEGKAGAAILATTAALRSGVGLVNALVPQHIIPTINTLAPEAMTIVGGVKNIDSISQYEAATAIAIGMGMGTEEATAKTFAQFVTACNIPCVFDADALNMLAAHKELMNKIPQNSIFTPHWAESNRLFGADENSMQHVENIRMQAMRNKICIVLKGHHTVVVSPDGDCYYNNTGNAGMAKGGSGDVLSGLLAGLLAQGYTALQAALLGVYLHGLAGDAAAETLGQEAMNATDIIAHLGTAWKTLSKT